MLSFSPSIYDCFAEILNYVSWYSLKKYRNIILKPHSPALLSINISQLRTRDGKYTFKRDNKKNPHKKLTVVNCHYHDHGE